MHLCSIAPREAGSVLSSHPVACSGTVRSACLLSTIAGCPTPHGAAPYLFLHCVRNSLKQGDSSGTLLSVSRLNDGIPALEIGDDGNSARVDCEARLCALGRGRAPGWARSCALGTGDEGARSARRIGCIKRWQRSKNQNEAPCYRRQGKRRCKGGSKENDGAEIGLTIPILISSNGRLTGALIRSVIRVN